MTNETKSDYALWNEYLNTPREVFVRKHGIGFSTGDFKIWMEQQIENGRLEPYTLIEMLTEPEGKYLEYSEPYGYETKHEEYL
tara:strand:- start:797 stop:1045 length:249 start_codon:yes stop_codon:yes gene_type:complete